MRGCFSDGGGFISFLSGGHWGGIGFDEREGGGRCEKNRRMEGAPLPHAPHTMGNPSNMDVDVLKSTWLVFIS